MPEPFQGDWQELSARLGAVMAGLRDSGERAASLRVTLDDVMTAGARRRARNDLLEQSQVARLRARLASQPVIEQAKGMLMAQRNCDAEEAFAILVRASQRTNRKVRDLAADLVRSTATRHGDATASSAGGQPVAS